MRLLVAATIALGSIATGAGAQVVGPASAGHSQALAAVAFAPQAQPQKADPIGDLLARDAFSPDGEPVRWRSGAVSFSQNGGAVVDELRVSVGGALRTPGGLPLDLDRAEFDAQAYEVAFTRGWPGAVSFTAGEFDVDVSPHAGVGLSSAGGSAQAGATLTLGQRLDDEVEDRLRDIGVRDGAAFGDQGRWYLFAAASGRAVGLNVLRGSDGWDRAGWSTDPSSALIGDAHAGVAWRKGPVQASFGYIHREVKGSHMLFGYEAKDDDVVAFSFAIKPGR